MQTKLITTHAADALEQALAVLAAGGLIAFPTDTVYGLAARVDHTAGIERLYQAKERAANKAIAVLIGEIDQLALLTTEFTASAQQLARAFWPGALTLIVPKKSTLPTNLSSLPTVGVRMPDHAFAQALMRRSGPLATSSANLSGESNTITAAQVMEQLTGRVELVVDGGTTPGGVPSTVVDCTQDPPVILRQGAVSAEAIQAVLKPFSPVS